MRPFDPKTGILSLNTLTIQRGEKELVSNLNLTLNPGDMVWIKGSNGIGKTSLLKCIAGLLRPASGDVLWNGHDIKHQRGVVAYQGHSDSHKGNLTATENLEFWDSVYGYSSDIASILKRVHLSKQRELQVKHFSAGQSRRLALARLLIANSPLWVLDEPAAAMDMMGRELIQSLLQEHITREGCILLASHGIPDKIGASTRILTLNRSQDERD